MSSADDEVVIEAELKFQLDDPESFRRAIAALGANRVDEKQQRDIYYAHPLRDFAETDEALRVRFDGESGCLTYKGPRFDPQTKSRQETELAFAGGAADARNFGRVLETLGFSAVREVSKRRESWTLPSADGETTIAIDCVDGLGTYVELEQTVPAGRFAEAKQAIESLASELGLTAPEHRSYLGMLLKRESTDSLIPPM